MEKAAGDGMERRLARARVAGILPALEREYPIPAYRRTDEDPWEFLVKTQLAVRCTDAYADAVAQELFEKYPDCFALAEAPPEAVERCIRSCGLYRRKARSLVLCARKLVSEYGGKVPDSLQELLTLPGIGRRSANVIFGERFGAPGAVVLDANCIRLVNRMGLVDHVADPEKVERILRAILPPERSLDFCYRLTLHASAVCGIWEPGCGGCCCARWCRVTEPYLAGMP
jgi:endonuclease-3